MAGTDIGIDAASKWLSKWTFEFQLLNNKKKRDFILLMLRSKHSIHEHIDVGSSPHNRQIATERQFRDAIMRQLELNFHRKFKFLRINFHRLKLFTDLISLAMHWRWASSLWIQMSLVLNVFFWYSFVLEARLCHWRSGERHNSATTVTSSGSRQKSKKVSANVTQQRFKSAGTVRQQQRAWRCYGSRQNPHTRPGCCLATRRFSLSQTLAHDKTFAAHQSPALRFKRLFRDRENIEKSQQWKEMNARGRSNERIDAWAVQFMIIKFKDKVIERARQWRSIIDLFQIIICAHIDFV